ncbi:MAG TPA: DUF2007 domain-containing protein [Salinimicrobium sp.]|nr:DUF2007 domain-containing protein [Salinimicrobium sp.]
MSEIFKTIAVFQYSSEAQIIKGKLESEGVTVFMTDNHTIDTDPLVSNAIGGVKLKIYADDEERAKEILDSITEFSLDDKGEPIHCQKCNSTNVDLFTNIKSVKALASFLFSFLLGVLPFYQKYQYHCEDCKAKFNL